MPRFGLLAPAGTPKDVLDKLQSEPVKALAMPEVRKKFDELGIDPFGNPYKICDASNHTPTPSRQTVASTG